MSRPQIAQICADSLAAQSAEIRAICGYRLTEDMSAYRSPAA